MQGLLLSFWILFTTFESSFWHFHLTLSEIAQQTSVLLSCHHPCTHQAFEQLQSPTKPMLLVGATGGQEIQRCHRRPPQIHTFKLRASRNRPFLLSQSQKNQAGAVMLCKRTEGLRETDQSDDPECTPEFCHTTCVPG